MRRGTRTALIALCGATFLLSTGGLGVLRSGRPVWYTDGEREINAADLANAPMVDQMRPIAVAELPGPVLGRAQPLPDGRVLYGRVGADGTADLVAWDPDRRDLDPVPELGLNSAAQDFAPAFGLDGALYFASDRAGGRGGYDVYRAPFVAGRFGRPQPLGEAVNTPADEVDPAPSPDGERLVFVRRYPEIDDGRNGSLYLANVATGEPAVPLREQQESDRGARRRETFIDREPAFSLDGRSLWFVRESSLRPGELELMRTDRHRDRWAEPVRGLNALGFRAPAVDFGSEGYDLDLLRTARPGGVAAGDDVAPVTMLYRSEARLVYPWWEGQRALELYLFIAALVSLLLLILLLLGQRWSSLDIVTWCVLASLLLHLLILLWLSTVEILLDPLPAPGAEDRLAVRMISAERGGSTSRRSADGAEESPSQQLDRIADRAAYRGRQEALDVARPDGAVETANRRVNRDLAEGRYQREVAATEDARPEQAELVDTAAPVAARSGQDRLAATVTRSNRATQAEQSITDAQRAASEREQLARAAPSVEVASGELSAAADVGMRRRELDGERAAPSPFEDAGEFAAAAPSDLDDAPADPVPTRSASDLLPSVEGRRIAPANAAAAAVTELDANDRATRAADGLQRAAPSVELRTDAVAAAPRRNVATDSQRAEAIPDASATAPEVAAVQDRPTASSESSTRRRADDVVAPVTVAAATPRRSSDASGTPAEPTRRVDAEASDTPAAAMPTIAMSALAEPRRARRSRNSERSAPELAAARRTQRTPVLRDNVETSSVTAPAAAADELARTEAQPVVTALDAPTVAASVEPTRRSPVDVSGAAGAPSATIEAPREDVLPEQQRVARLEAERSAALTAKRALAKPRVALLDDLGPVPEAEPVVAATAPERAVASSAPAVVTALVPAVVDLARPERRAGGFHEGGRDPISSGIRVPPSYLARAPRRVAERVAAASIGVTPKKRLYSNRFGPAKAEALERFGGTAETERAVRDGLRYLAGIQNARGYWGSRRSRDSKYGRVHVGKSALCVLAFLGAGHTPDSATQYSDNVRRAIDYLLSQQDDDTGHFGATSAYSHGATTYALAECYAMTRDDALEEPLRRAVRWIARNQDRSRDPRSTGGWGYFSPSLRAEDRFARTSVTAWQVMALESARRSGIDVVGEDVLERADGFLWRMFDPRRGWFYYNKEPDRLASRWPTLPGSSPAAAFCLLLRDADRDDFRLRAALEWTVERRPRRWRRVSDDDFVLRGQGNPYFFYYGTLACFFAGGEYWDDWNESLRRVLPEGQNEDGSWSIIGAYGGRYARDDDDDLSYTTAMAVLCLEVYYRYFTPLLERR